MSASAAAAACRSYDEAFTVAAMDSTRWNAAFDIAARATGSTGAVLTRPSRSRLAQDALPLPQVPNGTPIAILLSPNTRQPRRQAPLNDTPSMVTVPRPLGRSPA